MRQGRKRSRERGHRSCSRRKHSRRFSYSGYDRRRRQERGRSYERDRSRRRRSRNGRNLRDSRDRRYKGGRTTRSESHSDKQSFHSSGSSSIDDEVGHYHGRPGSLLRDRYVVQEELGKGTFGKVFKCHDRKHNDIVAVKVVRSIERYIDSAVIEADLLNDIYERQKELRKNYCVKMFSRFRMDDHYCMVFETLGKSLYDVIKANDYKRLPMPMVRDISRQLIEAMHFLKSVNLIHTDLKLENVLFVHTAMHSCEVTQGGKTYTVSVPEKSRIKLIDFGGATYDNDPRKSRVINTRQYRGPEVILELGWSFPSDLWSVGCIIGEIYRGDLFFQTHDELEHLALMEKLRGMFPMSMIQSSEFRSKYFDRDGRVRYADLSRDSRSFVRDAMTLEEFFALEEADKSTGIIQLVEGLLQLDPNRRLTAEEALRMPFLQQSTADAVDTSEGSTTVTTGSSL